MFHENPNEFIVCTCSTAQRRRRAHSCLIFATWVSSSVEKHKHCDGQENKNKSMKIACVHYFGVEVTKSVSHYAPRSNPKCVKSKHTVLLLLPLPVLGFVFFFFRILPFTFVYPIPPNWKPPKKWRERESERQKMYMIIEKYDAIIGTAFGVASAHTPAYSIFMSSVDHFFFFFFFSRHLQRPADRRLYARNRENNFVCTE